MRLRTPGLIFFVLVLIFANTVESKSKRAKEPVYTGPIARQFSQTAPLSSGISATITIIADQSEEGRATTVLNQLLSGAQQLDTELNNKDSGEIARINELGSGRALKLNDNTFALISKAVELAAVTNGWFDITAPSKKGIFSARDYRKIKLDEADKTIRFKSSGMKIDVSTIWPAYLADLLLAYVAKEGFSNARVDVGNVSCNIGNDIYTPWYVAVDVPTQKTEHAYRSTMYSFSNKAVVNLSPEKITNPLIDPKSKDEVPNNFKNITVFGNDSITTSALAYAIYTLGPKMLLSFTSQHPEAQGIFIDNEGNLTTSKNMKFNHPLYIEEALPGPTVDMGPNDLKQKKIEEERE